MNRRVVLRRTTAVVALALLILLAVTILPPGTKDHSNAGNSRSINSNDIVQLVSTETTEQPDIAGIKQQPDASTTREQSHVIAKKHPDTAAINEQPDAAGTKQQPAAENPHSIVSIQSSHVQYFLKHWREVFYGDKPGMETLLENLARIEEVKSTKNLSMVDIGAGRYKGASDDCLIAHMIRLFGCNSGVRYFGFEPQAHAAERSITSLQERFPQQSDCVQFEIAGAGEVSGNMTLYGSENSASVNAEDIKREYHTSQKIAVYSMNDYLRDQNVHHLQLLKIDTEGFDWKVVLGSNQLIEANAVDIVVIEYGDKWNTHTWGVSYKNMKPKPVWSQPMPHLHGVVKWFDHRGYDAFFVGENALLQINGKHWDFEFEVCANSLNVLGTPVCWFDVAFISRKAPWSSKLQSLMQPH